MNVYLPNLRLPSAYQEVEYIQSSGTQYINTGVINHWNTLNINMKFLLTELQTGVEDGIFGAKYSSSFQAPVIYTLADSSKMLASRAGSGTSANITSAAANTEYSLDFTFTTSSRSWVLNGVSGSSSTGISNSANNRDGYMALFADGSNPVSYSKLKLYYCKITVNGTLVRDLIPCYRKSDNVIGLYDLVNNQFYTNAGSGTFSKGNDVTMSVLKNAYIGEAPYEGDELCFTANTAGSTIRLTKTGSPTAVSLETSTDGKTWTPYTIGNTITLSNIGDKVYWRNTSTTNTGFNTSDSNYYRFVMTGSISGSGDINYLLNKNSTTTVSNYCYYYLFSGCKALTKAPSLPATTLASSCYGYMFSQCTGLTTAPALPATTLTYRCYWYMFNGCTSLTTAPALPATTLNSSCYGWMFNYCTNLTSLPKLPATTLADQCYRSMYEGCSKIKLSTTQTGEYQTPYRIPTTGTGTSSDYSLNNMFYNTGGTFKSTPSINTTYYTSNTVV